MSNLTILGFDEQGWVNRWQESEGPARPARPDEHPVDMETHALTKWQAVKFDQGDLAVPHDDREAWKRHRQLGRSGPEAAERLLAHAALRARFKDAGAVPGEIPHGSAHAGVHVFDQVPGLVLRPFGAEDLATIAGPMIESALYPATCPGSECRCNPPDAHAWIQLAQRTATGEAYQFCLEFQGRPLQHEIILRSQTHAVFSLTVHHTRERPSWFWKEAEAPVFELLERHGTLHLESRTRLDRPDWIASLKANYGATELSRDDRIQRLRFPLAQTFAGWPARKAVNFDQTLGRVRLWEATEAELPALHQLIDDTVPPARKALAHRVAEEWWHLDRATLLLGARDGVLRYARAIRPRRGTQGGMTFLSGLFDEPELEDSAQLALRWAKLAGYTTLSIFAKPEALAAGRVPQLIASRNPRRTQHTKFREPFTELEFDVL